MNASLSSPAAVRPALDNSTNSALGTLARSPGTVGTDHVGQLSANQQDRDRQAHGSPFEVLGAQLRVVPRRGHHGRIPVPVPASVSQAQIPLQALGTARLVAVRQILATASAASSSEPKPSMLPSMKSRIRALPSFS